MQDNNENWELPSYTKERPKINESRIEKMENELGRTKAKVADMKNALQMLRTVTYRICLPLIVVIAVWLFTIHWR